jgi:AhpD family alkylhydroperoxidase
VKHEYCGRLYSAGESYRILVEGLRAATGLRAAKKHRDLDRRAVERIMLAVTEVNGCEVCSYAHTRMALERGMAIDEIRKLLEGDTGTVPADEALAVMFAQHDADARGRPSREAWQRLVGAYGERKAFGILGAARVMMIANVYGIALSALLDRLRGRAIPKSSLPYEVGMLLSIVPFTPVALVHAAIAALLQRPIIHVGWQPPA